MPQVSPVAFVCGSCCREQPNVHSPRMPERQAQVVQNLPYESYELLSKLRVSPLNDPYNSPLYNPLYNPLKEFRL